jgi:hypothetical protein
MAAEGLIGLGRPPAEARAASELFRMHDERVFDELEPVWNDEERFVIAARETSRAMERLLSQDLQDLRSDQAAAGAESAAAAGPLAANPQNVR